MPTDPTILTLALILTAGGAVVAAGLVTGLVQILKTLIPSIVSGAEQRVAFLLSAVIVSVAVASGVQEGVLTLSIASAFGAFLAWYGIARIALGIHDDVTGARPTSLRA